MEPRAVLASLPWASLSEPSLGLAILKAQLAREQIECRVLHLNIGLLRHLTSATYQQVAGSWGLNEFVFTGLLDQDFSPDQAQCLFERCHATAGPNNNYPYQDPVELGRLLIRLRHEIVPAYVEECVREIVACRPTLVGFTCLFDQSLASAALARRVREELPEALIVLGGYALEGPVASEMLRAFPWIDAIAGGDGEPVIGRLARASVGEEAAGDIPGVLTRGKRPGPRLSYVLDESPPPDYSDWFADVDRIRRDERITIKTSVLPVESSRGCWWGQKQHCVFCGIDEETLKYRRKAPESVLAMLAHMRDQFGHDTPFRFSDYILPHDYVTTLLPALAAIRPKYELHGEMKANQSEERMAALADAGFTDLQPGIESFDSDVLRLMKKGVRGIHNVQTLKLGYEHGILINYNLIYGIPGERLEAYVHMAEMLPRLYHLTPPVTRTEAIITRFAPLHVSPAAFAPERPSDFRPRHHRCYDVLFSEPFLEDTAFSLEHFAYYFERYFEFSPEFAQVYNLLNHEVDYWKDQHRKRAVYLSWEEAGDNLLIEDSRFGEAVEHRLTGLASHAYRLVDRVPRTRADLAASLGCSDEALDTAVRSLDEKKLVWREDDRLLGLATPRGVVDRHRDRRWQGDWTSLYC